MKQPLPGFLLKAGERLFHGRCWALLGQEKQREQYLCGYRLYFAHRYGALILNLSWILGKKDALCYFSHHEGGTCFGWRGLQKTFGSHCPLYVNYLKPEILPPEYSKLISNASLIRNRSDYEDFYSGCGEISGGALSGECLMKIVLSDYSVAFFPRVDWNQHGSNPPVFFAVLSG